MEIKKHSSYYFLLIMFIYISSCTKDSLKPRNYVDWVHNTENGLLKEKKVGEIEISAQFKPLEYIVAMEQQRNKISSEVLSNRVHELGDMMDYLNVKISPSIKQQNIIQTAVEHTNGNFDVINYLAFDMQNDFYMLDGADTLKCKLFQFVQHHQLAPHIEFALGFEKKPTKDRLLVYDDKLFQVGPVKIKFRKDDIENCPKL